MKEVEKDAADDIEKTLNRKEGPTRIKLKEEAVDSKKAKAEEDIVNKEAEVKEEDIEKEETED